jgi:general nucleoside transport system permease protein
VAATRTQQRFTQRVILGFLTPIIAIILALIVSGVIILVFITSYRLSDEAWQTLQTQDVPAEALAGIESLKGKDYATRAEFEKDLLRKMASFGFTAKAFEQLQADGAPADILAQMQDLKKQDLVKQSALLRAIKDRIGKEALLEYREPFLQAADQHEALRATIMDSALRRENPVTVYTIVFQTALGNRNGWAEVLFRATPLIFTGLAVAFAFQCGLFNIGGEGQMVMGGFASAWIGFTLTGLPGFLLIPLCILMGAAVGAFWGAIPGYLKARLGVHEVVNTIMLNWIAVALIQYLTKVYKEPADMIPQTAEIADAAKLSRLHRYFGFLFPKHAHLNTSIFVALIAAVALWYILTRTKIGYEIRAVGFNAMAAECGGISVAKNVVLAMAISGAVAGLVGVNQVMGDKHRFLYEIFEGKGFDGIGVALIGKNHPFGVVLAAVLFGVLEFGGFSASVQTSGRVPREIILILKAIILVFVVVSGEITKRILVLAQKRKGGQA